MISLRKAMQAHIEDSLQLALGAYRAALLAVGKAGVKACPPAGEQFQKALLALHVGLSAEAPPSQVLETEKRLEAELENWGAEAARFYQDKTNDVKDILSLVAKAATELGERDQRYATQFGRLTERLRGVSKLTDLGQIRDSLQVSLADLTDCVTGMTKDGRDSVAQLRSQLAAYETQLEEVQRIASVDALTGLFNRRGLESRLERRIDDQRGFTIVYLDLNGFKQLNDTLGHAAGDDLLKQFGGELRSVCRASDIVGRWGGDEFLVVVDDARGTDALIERIDQWVAGDYSPSAAVGEAEVGIRNSTKPVVPQKRAGADAAHWSHEEQSRRSPLPAVPQKQVGADAAHRSHEEQSRRLPLPAVSRPAVPQPGVPQPAVSQPGVPQPVAPQKVKISCAAGVATWQKGEGLAQVLHRADAAMYAQKARMKSAAFQPACQQDKSSAK